MKAKGSLTMDAFLMLAITGQRVAKAAPYAANVINPKEIEG
jgi:hypothetical protein